MNLSEISALITGGASGLGESVVRHVVDAGGRAAIIDPNSERASSLVSELGESVIHAGCDVTDENEVKKALENTVKAFGSVNAVVNCAGIAIAEKTLGREAPHSIERYKKVIDVNLTGSFNTSRIAASYMEKNEANEDGEKGIIIFTASVAAFDGQKGQAAYSASKGGIVGMTLPMARDLAQYGIRVNTIAPGLFNTPMVDSLPEAAAQALVKLPLFPKRLGHTSEFAKLAGFLIENPYINAETIRLDAGVRLP